MDRGVAARALPARLEAEPRMGHTRLHVESGMALQAKLAAFAPHEQHAVRAPMRGVARGATLDLRRWMLIDKGPAFLGMTIHAGLKVWFVQASHIHAAVGIVAVRALHQVLRHPMMDWQGELRLNRAVAAETELWFRFLEQAVVQPADFIG